MECNLKDSAGIDLDNAVNCSSTSIITFFPFDSWIPQTSKGNNPFTLQCTDDREPNVVIISNPFNVGTAPSETT